MAKISVSYAHNGPNGIHEILWVEEGKNAYYSFDEEEQLWWFHCDDNVLVVNNEFAQLISFEFEGKNEDQPEPKKGKKK